MTNSLSSTRVSISACHAEDLVKTNENFIPFSNNVTFRKPRAGTDLVTASELIPGFRRSKSNVPTPGSLRTIKSPTGG